MTAVLDRTGRLCASVAGALMLAVGGGAAFAQDAGPAAQRFDIDSIEVAGATVLTADEIETVVYRFTGPGRSAADVEAARKALQDLYVAKGYEAVVVDIPPQDEAHASAGILQIRVSEVPVANVRVTGAKHHSPETVLAQVSALKAGEPLNLHVLQTQLVEANRVPDRSVEPAIKPAKTEGQVDVELKVRDKSPWHADLDLTNDHSPNTHPLRLSAGLRYTNLWGAGHTISGAYIVAPQARREAETFVGSYNAPIYGSRWSIGVSGYKSNSNVAALGGTQVLGNGYQVGVRANYTIVGTNTDQVLSAGFDYKNFKQNIVLTGNSTIRTPIRYIPLVLGYSWSRAGDKTSIDLSVTGTIGLRVMHVTDPCGTTTTTGACLITDQFALKDEKAVENFGHINFDLRATHVIADDTSVVFHVAGQYADSHLVTNEQFAVGGVGSVRGFYQSEAVGDRGIAPSLELDAPNFAGDFPDFIGEFRPYFFVDAGYVSIIDPTNGQFDHYTLASAGAGLRWRLFKHLSGEVIGGWPLKTVANSTFGVPRITFSARGEF